MSPTITFIHEDADNGVIAFTRERDGQTVVVLLNLSDTDLADYSVPNFPADRAWREWTKQYDVEVSNSELALFLARREGLIFVKD